MHIDWLTIESSIYWRLSIYLAVGILLTFLIKRLTRPILYQFAKRNPRIHSADQKKYADTISGILETLLIVLVWSLIIVVILQKLKINLSSILTSAGLIGAIVGFGAQATIRDILAGMFIITENQYRVGDVITLTIGNHLISGTVEQISLRITKLRDMNGKLYTIRNDSPVAITNNTFGHANINMNLNVSYDNDLKLIEKIVNKIGQDIATETPWNNAILDPIRFLRVNDFLDSYMEVKVLGKVKPAFQWEIAGEFRRRLLLDFKKHGVEFPSPKLDVKLVDKGSSRSVTARMRSRNPQTPAR